MTPIQPGDVIWALFPYQDRNASKPRPCLVVKVLPDGDYACAAMKITSQLKRAEDNPGYNVKPGTPEFESMGLKKESYIEYNRIENIASRDILEYKHGHCPADLFERILSAAGFI